ncbi:hypothetical protein, partial [Streptomyces spongiae]|uniref:hypothetical protein n=1 Tax=Streptomyces spongiae TaxID=565072 RepID=UPI001D1555C8
LFSPSHPSAPIADVARSSCEYKSTFMSDIGRRGPQVNVLGRFDSVVMAVAGSAPAGGPDVG